MPELEKDLRLLNSAIDTALGANCELVKLPVTVAIEIRELLKAQKPVKPRVWIPKNQTWATVRGYYCTNCDTNISMGDRYCHHCGRGIQWDD